MTTAVVEPASETSSILRRNRLMDALLRSLTRAAAIIVLIMLGGVIISLVDGALPALKTFGFSFVTTESWNPVTEKFGAAAPIYGTLVTAFIAMLIGVPISIGIAIFITELCPRPLKRPISTAIELLAGIPSIIYGIWGLFVLAPLLQAYVQPALIGTFENVPMLNNLFAGPPYGIGVLTAALILSIMVLPFITSITRDVFETVPAMLKESAYGLGCTTWEVVRYIVLPYSRTGIIGGIMLGLGRALGETLAIAMVLSPALIVKFAVLQAQSPNTIAANIALQFPEATGLGVNALIASGLVLFVVTLLINMLARYIVSRRKAFSGAN